MPSILTEKQPKPDNKGRNLIKSSFNKAIKCYNLAVSSESKEAHSLYQIALVSLGSLVKQTKDKPQYQDIYYKALFYKLTAQINMIGSHEELLDKRIMQDYERILINACNHLSILISQVNDAISMRRGLLQDLLDVNNTCGALRELRSEMTRYQIKLPQTVELRLANVYYEYANDLLKENVVGRTLTGFHELETFLEARDYALKAKNIYDELPDCQEDSDRAQKLWYQSSKEIERIQILGEKRKVQYVGESNAFHKKIKKEQEVGSNPVKPNPLDTVLLDDILRSMDEPLSGVQFSS